jgi:hypothetical protein
MAFPDPEHERQRLTELYNSMSDGELQAIADDAPNLTDVARQLLGEELRRRGSALELQHKTGRGSDGQEPPTSDAQELPSLVPVQRFQYLQDALLAKSRLESAGIECFLADDNTVRMSPYFAHIVGGVRLVVGFEDLEAATEVLNQPIPESFEVEGVGVYQQPRCPQCGSVDISFEHVDREASLVLALPLAGAGWTCEACGHNWQESPKPTG